MTLEQKILTAQQRIFRLAERDHDLTLKRLSLDSGIKYETLRSYAGNKGDPAMMPVSALCKLVGVVPDELLSQILDPVGKHIADNGGGDEDLDALGEDGDALATEVRRSRHPDSLDGTNIHPIEREAILGKARKLRAA